MAGPVLGYWAIRGHAHPIRLLLAEAGVTYNEKRYTKRKDWLDDKENLGFAFPNLPYYIDDEVMLTQSTAIVHYIARKHQLDGSNDHERRIIDLLLMEMADVREECFTLAYVNANEFESAKEKLLKNYLPKKLKNLSKYLGGRPYFVVDKALCVDFVVYEALLLCLELEPECLDKHKNLVNFLKRIEELPKVNEYISLEDTQNLPFNACTAHFGSKKPLKPTIASPV